MRAFESFLVNYKTEIACGVLFCICVVGIIEILKGRKK